MHQAQIYKIYCCVVELGRSFPDTYEVSQKISLIQTGLTFVKIKGTAVLKPLFLHQTQDILNVMTILPAAVY